MVSSVGRRSVPSPSAGSAPTGRRGYSPPRPRNRRCSAARRSTLAAGRNGRSGARPGSLNFLRCGAAATGSAARTDACAEFERGYAQLLGAKRCLATASGTTALIVSLHVMDVDAGDEVIVSPYTFSASYNAILSHKALPVFADTDPATLTMDPASIESRITERTRAIMPVHIFGMPCDMDAINAIARKHKLAVVEDACQAWLAEYKGRKCGTLGDLGCFSFQESKHIPSGEGGAITSMSEELMDKCDSFHNCGRAVRNEQRQWMLHPRGQLPHDAGPGGDSLAAVRQAGQGDRNPPRERRLSERQPPANPRHHAHAPAGEQPGGVASLRRSATTRRNSTACRARSSRRRSRPKACLARGECTTSSITTACSTRRSPRAASSGCGAPSGSRPTATASRN